MGWYLIETVCTEGRTGIEPERGAFYSLFSWVGRRARLSSTGIQPLASCTYPSAIMVHDRAFNLG